MRKDDFAAATADRFQARPMPPLFGNLRHEPEAVTQRESEVRRQYREAVVEQRRAASKGNRSAQELLGLLCVVAPQIYGDAVDRDLAEAYRWLWLAAAQGGLVARQMLRKIDQNRAAAERGPAGI